MRVEFQMNVPFADVLRYLLWTAACRSHLLQTYVLVAAAIIALVWYGFVTHSQGEAQVYGIVAAVSLACAAMLLPARGLSRAARKAVRDYQRTVYFMDELGFGQRSSTGEHHIYWEAVTEIRETRRFIDLRAGVTGLVVFKRAVRPEQLAALRDLLAKSPARARD